MSHEQDFEDWKARAAAADIMEIAERLGANLKRAGAVERVGPCPKCGGVDRFACNIKDRVFLCRGTGGGDVLSMVQHVLDCGFVEACEFILQEHAPRSNSERPSISPEIAKERREDRRDERQRQDAERVQSEAGKLAEDVRKATDLFNRAKPVQGTLAETYLTDWRGIPEECFARADLRFMLDFPYYGEDETGARKELGRFACMIAAMKLPDGRICGIKRTYLGADGRKLKTPDGKAAKKGLYTMVGGLIHLMPISETLALGEGVETSYSALMLAQSGYFGPGWEGLSVAGADSLGNLASDTLELPDHVRRLIYLIDGDSNPKTTREMIEKGAASHRELGLEVLFAAAPTHPVDFKAKGKDWSDVWAEVMHERRAA